MPSPLYNIPSATGSADCDFPHSCESSSQKKKKKNQRQQLSNLSSELWLWQNIRVLTMWPQLTDSHDGGLFKPALMLFQKEVEFEPQLNIKWNHMSDFTQRAYSLHTEKIRQFYLLDIYAHATIFRKSQIYCARQYPHAMWGCILTCILISIGLPTVFTVNPRTENGEKHTSNHPGVQIHVKPRGAINWISKCFLLVHPLGPGTTWQTWRWCILLLEQQSK